jgi:hypothetical protein
VQVHLKLYGATPNPGETYPVPVKCGAPCLQCKFPDGFVKTMVRIEPPIAGFSECMVRGEDRLPKPWSGEPREYDCEFDEEDGRVIGCPEFA